MLTKKRGEVIKNYLISQGIDKRRIGVVAWGSMEMIVNSTGKDAALNERVEFELDRD